MARPKADQPTPAELEVLKVLWERGTPTTVREVMDVLNRQPGPDRAYTSVMSLLNVMTEKGLLKRSPQGRAFEYEPIAPRDQTLRGLLGETLERAYSGSASLLMTHLLDQATPTSDELTQIRALLDAYQDRMTSQPKEGEEPRKALRSKRSSK